MDDDDPAPRKARFVVGEQPVNRRSADPALYAGQAEQDEHPQLVARAQQLLQRHALGVPLAEQLAPDEQVPAATPVPALAVAGIIGGTALLAWALLTPGSASKAAIGVASLVFYGLAWHGISGARRRSAAAMQPQGRAAWPHPDALLALDLLLDEVAPELTPELLASLVNLKATLVRVSLNARATGVSPAFTAEDQFHLQETVRRYLPDSLQAYLRVPPERRSQPLDASGITASQALASQLLLIQQGLDEREARCAQGAGEGLLLQQRFLQSKAKPPTR
jgi:hypothetical protein